MNINYVFSETEVETIFNLLQRVRKNIEIDWDFVKRIDYIKGATYKIDY
jgi:hypothetical protein